MDNRMTENRTFHGKKAVVTGGAGFIGSHIVKALLGLDARVTVLDDFSTGDAANLPANSGIEFVHGSVADADLVQRTVQDAVFVFHEASSNIPTSLTHPLRDCTTNVLGTLQVLLAVQKAATVRKVVYASTDSVYGNSRYLPINEDDPTSTLSPFAASKLAGENYCKAFYESFGIRTTVLRYANVFGPCSDSAHRHPGVVDRFVKSALIRKPLSIHGDGEQTRDFLFVDDAVEATLLAALSSKADGQVYNVGSGFETTVVHLAQKIIEISGAGVSWEFVDRKDIDNIRRRALNIEKIRKDLRWTPKNTLEHGLSTTVDWHLKHGTEFSRWHTSGSK